MRAFPIYQVDAFTADPFSGNPAAVVPLADAWLEDYLMQQIAEENNLAETAFLLQRGKAEFAIRWFTPTTEVDLCGHATLASAYVAARFLLSTATTVVFDSPRSGVLPVEVHGSAGDQLILDFPAEGADPTEAPEGIARSLGVETSGVLGVYRGKRDLMVELASPGKVLSLTPDLGALTALPVGGVSVTAAVDREQAEPEYRSVDFVSRYFAPQSGIPEDSVTGSTHTTLAPFWAHRLGKRKLQARQLSRRGGELTCEVVGERVRIGGSARLYMRGEIFVGA